MLRMLMFSKVGFGWLISRGILRLILLLTQVVVISLKSLLDARRRLLQARSHWYPIMLDLHRFMIAVARVSVNHDGRGGTAPDLLVWDQGSRPKVRRLAIRVDVDLASLPGPSWFLRWPWFQVAAGRITGAEKAAYWYSVCILVRSTSFLNTLHWRSGSVDLGHFGIFFLELLILFEQRSLNEKVTRPHVRANRPILIPSVPVSEGIEIRHGCQFLSSLIRALAKLPGGLGRFLPCSLGSHMSRLRHLGWNQGSHGLSSRPLESCHNQCFKAVCGVLGYPKGSALELLDGTLNHCYCTAIFTTRFPPWSLARVGNGSGKRQFGPPGHLTDPGGNLGKRVLLTRKTRPSESSRVIPDPGHPTPRRWKRLRTSSSVGEGGEVGEPRNLFLDLELGEVFALGDVWNLPSWGTGVVECRLVSSRRG